MTNRRELHYLTQIARNNETDNNFDDVQRHIDTLEEELMDIQTTPENQLTAQQQIENNTREAEINQELGELRSQLKATAQSTS